MAAADARRRIRFRAADKADGTTNTNGSKRAADTGARQMGGCRPGHHPHYTNMPHPCSPSFTHTLHARCTHVAARRRTVSVQDCTARRGTADFTFDTNAANATRRCNRGTRQRRQGGRRPVHTSAASSVVRRQLWSRRKRNHQRTCTHETTGSCDSTTRA